jgi:MraZ protein
MAFLLGTSRHRFDEKWRVVLPSQHRDVIGGSLYFAPGDQGQVVLFPEAAFQERMNDKAAAQREGAAGVKAFLQFTKTANRTQMDMQGRVVLPEYFRPRMTQAVVIIGAMDRLEFWSESQYAEFFGDEA